MPGDKGKLITNPDLQGCFCVRFYRHQNIGTNDGAALEVLSDSQRLASYTGRNPKWNEVKLQMDTPNKTRVGKI